MIFDLHVTFAGMCMLVLHGGQLHVLMPSTGWLHPHKAVLVYEARQENPAAPEDSLVVLPLEGSEIDLTGLPGGGPPTLQGYAGHADIVNLSADLQTRRTVPLKWLRPGTSSTVRSRVTLATGTLVDHVPGGQWSVEGGPPRPMATSAEWKVVGAGTDSLVIEVEGRHRTRRVLRPLAGESKVHIVVMHVPGREVPRSKPTIPPPVGEPKHDSEARHFGAFYKLVAPGKPSRLPRYRKVRGWSVVGPTLAPELNFGREFTCIMTRADPEGT